MYSRLHNNNIGSVCCGSLLAEDLIPEFLYDLKHQKRLTGKHKKLAREIESRMETEGYYDSEDADCDIEELTEALQEYCMPYFYFGAHPNDGADYGYWLIEDLEMEFEGLTVSDLSEIEKGFTGEVLKINDHGNTTLYNCVRGRLYEIWGIV
ncbi:MAG: hypothetical protein WC373_13685 [Smithella sp.]|jgi:hypothetical protein